MTRLQLGALALVAALLAIYLPTLGAGFVRDDFAWIRSSAISGPSDAFRLFAQHNGFYRPLVSLSFGLNRFLGLDPIWYGAINLALLFGCVALLDSLLKNLGFDPAASIFGAGLWALNFHGIGMAVLWISGRTSLLLVLFALLAARASVREHWGRAACWTLLALFSKEEAVMLPVILLAWWWIGQSGAARPRAFDVARRAAVMLAPLAIYFALRVRTGAMTPLDAPDYYRFSAEPALLARNIVEYADRAATLSALVTIAALAMAWIRGSSRVSLDAADRRQIARGLVWLIGGYAITVWVPVRSSLYACFPSIGAALFATVLCRAAFRAMPPRRQSLAAIAVMILPFLLLPAYWARHRSYGAAGAVSRSVLQELRDMNLRPGTVLVIADEQARHNLASTFGGLFPDALELHRIPVTVCVEPGASCAPHPDGAQVIRLALRHGHLERP